MRNSFKELDLIDREPDELWMEVGKLLSASAPALSQPGTRVATPDLGRGLAPQGHTSTWSVVAFMYMTPVDTEYSKNHTMNFDLQRQHILKHGYSPSLDYKILRQISGVKTSGSCN